MDIFIALYDYPDDPSFMIGAFSTEDKAREACQDDEISNSGIHDYTPLDLDWMNAEAASGGGGKFYVIPAELDVAQ